RWPGRLERCPAEPRLWWDGAHNPQGAETLARLWREQGLPGVAALALAVSADKPLEAILEPLARVAPARHLIATRSRSERAMPAERIAAVAGAAGWSVRSAADVPAACRLALEGASPAAPALLTGSLFAVGEAMEALGGAPGEQL
ncbi:MAG TPA: bifunctional folylpolyglutamate synthase/dihydrofolate synthase, partial [Candidatus Eisenbacteria bacterium]